ncbi:MAG: hypothetical protein AAB131_21375, partial [Actinomycetota bacterium]
MMFKADPVTGRPVAAMALSVTRPRPESESVRKSIVPPTVAVIGKSATTSQFLVVAALARGSPLGVKLTATVALVTAL